MKPKTGDTIYFVEGQSVCSATVIAVGVKAAFIGYGTTEKLLSLDRIHASKEDASNALIALLKEELRMRRDVQPIGRIESWPKARPFYMGFYG